MSKLLNSAGRILHTILNFGRVLVQASMCSNEEAEWSRWECGRLQKASPFIEFHNLDCSAPNVKFQKQNVNLLAEDVEVTIFALVENVKYEGKQFYKTWIAEF